MGVSLPVVSPPFWILVLGVAKAPLDRRSVGLNQKSILTAYSTSEQSPLCSGDFYKIRRPLRFLAPPFQIEPAALGFDLVSGTDRRENRLHRRPWGDIMKKFLRALFIIAFSVIILLIAIYINHRIRLKQESELRSPLGEIVEVDGHNISI